ncbi:MAG: glycosyltransferase, partial [Planctomycetota bacterium]
VMAHKGVHVLAQALQLLPAGAVECIALGDMNADYAAQVRKLDVAGRLHLHGAYAQEVLPELLAKFDVVVVPSVWDDCAPYVVAEALAARCPVLGSRIGGIPDFIEHGRTGWLFAPGDARELAARLLTFQEDAQLLGRMQQAIAPPRGLRAFVADVRQVYAQVLANCVAITAEAGGGGLGRL